ncbi:MAG TPA: DUF1993 domain-containing protein [Methylibium sp.]|uniref:DUF1993 domain-containing protein n=1 Tax=Methylibium sp. TaxID=2067992 RepID=UPI002DBEFC84|nr:DUF1993 domain-containing protein [Methylibium sp.]HEU4460623.1 DUF1993 domain-containing protein [Methylibium sp.]
MSITMHSAAAPIYQTMLRNLSKWLDKAQAHAKAKGFDADTLLTARLAPDMLPLRNQIQIACDTAKFGLSRLAGIEAPKFADDEQTLAQLQQRIAQTLAFIESVPAASVDGSEDKPVSVPIRGRDPLQFTGEQYLRHFALPNFFFHVTTAYGLLRHNGVELGKGDYLRGG